MLVGAPGNVQVNSVVFSDENGDRKQGPALQSRTKDCTCHHLRLRRYHAPFLLGTMAGIESLYRTMEANSEPQDCSGDTPGLFRLQIEIVPRVAGIGVGSRANDGSLFHSVCSLVP